MKDSSYFRGHRAFSALKPGELEALALGFTRLQCPMGKTLILKDSPLEGLYLIESGLCRFQEEEGSDTFHTLGSGDFFFEDCLDSPRLSPVTVKAVEESFILFLHRDYYLQWAARYPRGLQRLELGPPGSAKKTVPVRVLKETRFLWLLKTLPWLLFPPVLLIRIFFRRINGTFIEDAHLICRYFRVKSLKNTNLTIPLEQIQSVEVVQRGIVSRLLKVGDLLVRVNGPQGNLLIRNIPRPAEEQERIHALKRREEELINARKHESIRKDIAGWIREEEGVVVLEKGFTGENTDSRLTVEFRKSFFVLLGRGWWQLLLVFSFSCLILWGHIQGASWLIFPVLALGVSAFLFFYTLLDWLNDKYKVEEGYLLDLNREPFGKKMTRKQAELNSIQNVIAEQKGFWANIFNYGNVRVIVPGSGDDITLAGVKRPRLVQERILFERKRWKDKLLEQESRAGQEDLKLYLSYASQELLKKSRS